MFYVVDRRNYLRAPKPVRARLAEPPDQFRCEGLWNMVFLGMILGAVLFLQKPVFAREAVMVLAAAGSYFTTKRRIHEANHFNWHPLKEVAVLFVGIFATMMPALDWLQKNSGSMGHPGPGFFYWGSGLLSSVLDNAPTYLSFLKAIFGACIDTDTVAAVQRLVQDHGAGLAAVPEPVRHTFEALQKYHADHLAAGTVTVDEIGIAFLMGNVKFNGYLTALSVGAVFFGANTYIGNGPNFMVKSIAVQQKVHAPTFPGYVFKFALPFMLPMLLVVWWLFFRR
jgi:Na+/H+ antiporter NhaD/arsenite permease-like protein